LVNNKYKGKVVLITGASSGIGETITNFFLKSGAHVIVCARRVALMKTNFQKFNKITYIKSDLSKPSETSKLLKIIKRRFKIIDILINNAGVAYYSPVCKIKREKIISSIEINFLSPLFITKEILKLMKKNNYGRVINISSGGAVNCEKNYLSYSATKAALNTLTRTLAKETKSYNVKINSMSPGPCKTSMFPKNPFDPLVCIPTVDYLASLKKSGYSGEYFTSMKKINIFPDLKSNKNQKKI